VEVVDAVVVVVGLLVVVVVVVGAAVVVVDRAVVVVVGAAVVVVVARAVVVVVVGAAVVVVVVATGGCEAALPALKPAVSSTSLVKPSPSESAVLRAAVIVWPAFANALPNALRVLGLAEGFTWQLLQLLAAAAG
jgi:hypothetical protein